MPTVDGFFAAVVLTTGAVMPAADAAGMTAPSLAGGSVFVSLLAQFSLLADTDRLPIRIKVHCVKQAERPIGARGTGRESRPGWGITYTTRARITVGAAAQTPVIREGCGAGHGIDTDLGQPHESALKEAETDAMERALMTFGNPFGLALYDKQQRQVTHSAGDSGAPPPASASNGPRSIQGSPSLVVPAAAAEASHDPIPLDSATTRQILATLRGLPRPVLEGFTKAYLVQHQQMTA